MRHAHTHAAHHRSPSRGGDQPDPTALELTVRRVDDLHAHVTVDGSLNLSAIQLVTGALDAQLRLGRRHVRVDLSEVTVSDVGCLRELTAVHERFLAAHGLLILDPVSPELLSLLQITGLDRTPFTTVPAGPSGSTTCGTSTPCGTPTGAAPPRSGLPAASGAARSAS